MNMSALIRLIFLSTLLSLSLPALAATSAGKVVYAFGDVSVANAKGLKRAASRGDKFGPGDTVMTGNGRAQIRFTDGGYAALQPNTEYKIEDYHYEGKADGKERSFLNLVRGSVRLVTGLIGRSNKSSFRLRTSVATIGIRGTSGKISHCEANCGELGKGTALSGYGGTWTLKTDTYDGVVVSGQSTFCSASSCYDIPGFGQRRDVASEDDDLDAALDENDESLADGKTEQNFQEGQQTDETGVNCEFADCASDRLVAFGQIGAIADQKFGEGDSEAVDNLIVVLENGLPAALISVNPSSNDASDDDAITFYVSNTAALRGALNDFLNPEQTAVGLQILDSIPDELISDQAANPASVALDDYGVTSDGLLIKGRWQDGLLLRVGSDLEAKYVFSDLIELTGFKSEHFIFGADPGPLPNTGIATYNFTGGTFSTAIDGSSIGEGVTDGQLMFDFLSGSGAIQMRVEHGIKTYQVLGDLALEFDRFFFSTNARAFSAGGGSYDAEIDGFFAAAGELAPLAAGVSYVINSSIPIIGVAGFGLDSVDVSIPMLTFISGQSYAVAFNGNNIPGFASPDDTGIGGSFPRTTSALRNGNPVSSVNFTSGVAFGSTVDLEATRESINELPNASATQKSQLLTLVNNIPASIRNALANNPATPQADTGFTSDGRLFYTRFANGNILDFIGVPGLPEEGDLALDNLTGFQSRHVIFGNNPVSSLGSGTARYTFTGGTRSTSRSGASIGNGVTQGNLFFDFGILAGEINMNVNHSNQNYQVFGPLAIVTNDTIFGTYFFNTGLTAQRGSNVFRASTIGQFDTGTSQGPLAALLSYNIRTSDPISGVAGFGFVGANVPASFSGPVSNNSYIAFAHNFEDTSVLLNSQAFDFIVGSPNAALQTAGVVTGFFSTSHPSLCSPSCTFDATGSTPFLDSNGPANTNQHAALGVSWVRWQPGYSVTHNQILNARGSGHVIKVDVPTPNAAVPLIGSGKVGTYNMLVGGTSPTMQYDVGGITTSDEEVGSLTTANMTINFGTGDLSANFGGNVSGGSWNLSGSNISVCPSADCFDRTDGIHALNMTGTVTSPVITNPSSSMTSCAGGCMLFGHTHFDLAGANASAVVGSFQGNTPQPSYPAFAVSGTYVLQGSISP